MGAKNRQKVIVLVQRILETQALLGRLEAELDGLTVPDSDGPVAANPVDQRAIPEAPATKTDSRRTETSLPERILAIMRRAPDRDFTSDDLRELESAGLAQMPNIRVALVRLHKAGRLLKASRGSYRLPPTE